MITLHNKEEFKNLPYEEGDPIDEEAYFVRVYREHMP